MNIKRDLAIILLGVALVGSYILLNKNYEEAVKSCVANGNDVSYCEYHAG